MSAVESTEQVSESVEMTGSGLSVTPVKVGSVLAIVAVAALDNVAPSASSTDAKFVTKTSHRSL